LGGSVSGSNQGGTASQGGASASGGSANGGKSAGGSANGGASSGGKSNGGGSANGGTAGTASPGGSGGASTCTPPAPGSKGKNPLFSDQYTADPAPLVYNCTFYIGCGHDEGSTGFVMREWFLLSSTDMVHWTKQVALKLSDFKWASANAWAGQIVGPKNGKFYWYVPVAEASNGGAMAIGVAVADSPTGPFKDALGKALVNDAFEMQNFGYSQASQTAYTIDPTVYIDGDGQAYLHYGSFGRMVEGKLNDDMISFNGKLQESTPQGFFEAPFLTKRNGVWYEIYAAGANPATIDYATSSSPMGPWTRKGRILDAMPGVAGQDAPTSHSGVAEFGGQWYIVYHVSNGPNGGGTYKREVAVDKLDFNSDGTIQKVTPTSGLSF
jgi:beta-xylosidase